MLSCVVLYGNTDTERAATYTLRVRDLAHALTVVPQCAAQHRFRCGPTCELTHWTLSTLDDGTQLFKIREQGAIDGEGNSHRPATGDGVANRDMSRGPSD